MSLLPSTIGDYRIVTQLGEGGMARALLALRLGQGGFRKLFVIKQLRLDLCNDPSYIEMFLTEARLAALLNHPNVVQTHEIGEDINSHFICMEYLEGQPLSRIWTKALRKTKAMPPLEMSIWVLAQVLQGLHYTHELTDLNGKPLSLVHRDISPGNIFVTYSGQVKLLDFGIAKVAGGDQTQVGVLKGKLSYMAPEQAQSQDLDGRTDLFAIGVMLWEAIAGKKLVPKNEPQAMTLQNRLKGNWPSIDTVKPDTPQALVDICNKAMAVDPSDRYANAKEMRAALLGCGLLSAAGPTTESVGTFVSGLFGDEKAEVDKAVSEAISKGAAVERIGGTSSSNNAWSDQPGSEPRTLRSFDSGVDIEVVAPTPSQVEPQQPAKTNRNLLIGLGLLGVSAAAAIAFMATRKSPSKGEKAVASAKPPALVAPSEQPVKETETTPTEVAPKEVSLRLQAIPAEAQITLDGEPLTNPYQATRAADSETHELVFSLDGYKPQTRSIHFSQNSELSIVLEALAVADADDGDSSSRSRRRRRARSRTADKTPVSTTPPASTDTSKPSKPRMGDHLSSGKPRKTPKIDRDSPYQ